MRTTLGFFFEASERQFMVRLFVLATLVRIAMNLVFRDVFVGPVGSAAADDVHYHQLAIALAEGRGYVLPDIGATAVRSPGMPLFLASIYLLAGDNPLVTRLALSALGGLTCVLTYLLARRLAPKESVARVAGLLLAAYLGSTYYAIEYLSEAVYAPILALVVLTFWRHLDTGSLLLLGLTGLILGYLALVRPIALLIAPFFAVMVLWRLRQQPIQALAAASVLTIATCVALAPWIVRNKVVTGHYVMTTHGGSTFYGSNNDLVSSLSHPRLLGYWVGTNELPGRDLIEAQPTEFEHDRKELELGLEWARNNLHKLPLTAVLKLMRVTLGLPDFDAGSLNYVFRAVSYLPYLALFIVGFAWCVTSGACRSEHWLALHAPNLALAITVVIFAGLPRFRDGNAALLMVYAAFGLEAVRQWLRKRRSGGTAARAPGNVGSPSA